MRLHDDHLVLCLDQEMLVLDQVTKHWLGHQHTKRALNMKYLSFTLLALTKKAVGVNIWDLPGNGNGDKHNTNRSRARLIGSEVRPRTLV